jgi:hypothetical protein
MRLLSNAVLNLREAEMFQRKDEAISKPRSGMMRKCEGCQDGKNSTNGGK